MNLQQYFRQYETFDTLALVGPLWDGSGTVRDPVIYVDGGARFRHHHQGIAVGDGDSFGAKLDISIDTDKDFSDLAFALDNIPDQFIDITLFGFLGGRRDHELFNFGEAHRFLNNRKRTCRMGFDGKVFAYSPGNWTFERTGLFSIAVLEKTMILLTGDCRYTCNSDTEFQPLSSLGLSNLGYGTIYMECDRPAMVIFEDEEK